MYDFQPLVDRPFEGFNHQRSHYAVFGPCRVVAGVVQIDLVVELKAHPRRNHVAGNEQLKYPQLAEPGQFMCVLGYKRSIAFPLEYVSMRNRVGGETAHRMQLKECCES